MNFIIGVLVGILIVIGVGWLFFYAIAQADKLDIHDE